LGSTIELFLIVEYTLAEISTPQKIMNI